MYASSSVTRDRITASAVAMVIAPNASRTVVRLDRLSPAAEFISGFDIQFANRKCLLITVADPLL
jgi:hypothetical protein